MENNDVGLIYLRYLKSYYNTLLIMKNNLKTEEDLLQNIMSLNFLIFQYLELYLKLIVWQSDLDYEMYDFKCLDLNGHDLRIFFNDNYLKNIVKKYDNDLEKFNEIYSLYKYFESFSVHEKFASESMRFPFKIYDLNLLLDTSELKTLNYSLYMKNFSRLLTLSEEMLLMHVNMLKNDAEEFIESMKKYFKDNE